MNRNVESHFSLLPSADIGRSKFDRSHSVKTSFNVGQIVPFLVEEVLPGDTFQIQTSMVTRLQTLQTPVMDNIYLDKYYFFVPYRLVWEHWRELNGENTASAWEQQTTYQVPQLEAPSGGWNVGTIADYFGIPTGVDNLSVSALPFRAYALIMSEWFRDENLSDPLYIPVDDSTVTGVNSGTFVSDVAKGGLPYTAAKYHDYFTSCLPEPQKGPDVPLPLGQAANVYTKAVDNPFSIYPKDSFGNAFALHLNDANSGLSSASAQLIGHYANDSNVGGQNTSDSLDLTPLYPSNLYVDLTTATGTSINQLRLAFQVQKLYERDARGGTRYIEILKSHFGVTSPDARLQRPEYLGGNRIPLNIVQITQNSESASTPQGTVTGLSVTTDRNHDFIKSFTEHGVVIGVMVARYDHTYQQGLERMWSRKDRFDFYWPVFANIGEQAVLNKEIYADGSSTDDEVFGYQEAWADYRYKPNHVTGMMRSAASSSLDTWHLADDYSALPSLSDSWIREDPSNVDRVLAISSLVSNQIFADIYIKNIATRPMPVYSIPGLIDHH